MVAHRVFQALDAAAFGEEEGEIVAVGRWQAQTRSEHEAYTAGAWGV
jgi:hypothetical protein